MSSFITVGVFEVHVPTLSCEFCEMLRHKFVFACDSSGKLLETTCVFTVFCSRLCSKLSATAVGTFRAVLIAL